MVAVISPVSGSGLMTYRRLVRERVRRVFEHHSRWKASQSISEKLKVNHESLRQWVRKAETDAGPRPGLTSDERARMKQLERENRELRPTNEILKAAASFFGAELDRQSQK